MIYVDFRNARSCHSLRAQVARYYFNLYDDLVSIDDEGKEFPDLDAARGNALREAREMACAQVVAGHVNFRHRIEIADEAGEVLETVHFGDAVQVQG
jgi:hypothetical protein